MKAAAQLKWPAPTPSTVELAIASCEPGRRVIVPQNAAEVKPKDMISVYEKMRRIIFGGGERLELQNVYYKEQGQGQEQGQVGRLSKSSAIENKSDEVKGEVSSKSQIQHNTYLSLTKNNERSHRMVVDMGRFVDVLARKEALRDPLLIDAGPEENSLQGLMNRKIVVDFGNRYKDEKGVGGSGGAGIDNMGMEIETSTGVKVIRQEKVQIDEDKNKEKDKDKDKDKEKEKQQLALLLDQTHTAYFMDTPLPPAEVDEGDEGEGDSDIGYGDSGSYLYTPMTISDSDNDNDNDMDTDSEFDKEEEGEGDGVRKGQGQGVLEKDEDPYNVGEYWRVIDVTADSPNLTIDDTNSTNSSPHTDSNTPHTHTHTQTLGIADRAHDLNVQTPSFTLSPLSSTFTSSSSTPVTALTSVTSILSLPPLGRPYASLNGKRKRQAGMGMGGVSLHLPSPTTPSSSSSSSTPTSTSTPTSSPPFLDTGNDGRSSPIHVKGQRQGSREDQYTPHSLVTSSLGGRKDQSGALSSVLPSASTSSSSSPSLSSSSSPSNSFHSFRNPVDGDASLLPPTPPLTPLTHVIESPLPAGWLQKFSNREKKNYWFNVITGESIWVKPSM